MGLDQLRKEAAPASEPGETFLKVTHGDPTHKLLLLPPVVTNTGPSSVLPRGDWEEVAAGEVPDLSKSLSAASISLYCPLSWKV